MLATAISMIWFFSWFFKWCSYWEDSNRRLNTLGRISMFLVKHSIFLFICSHYRQLGSVFLKKRRIKFVIFTLLLVPTMFLNLDLVERTKNDDRKLKFKSDDL